MSDLPPNNPDFYIQQDKINNPPIEHRLLEYPKISKEVWEVIITIKDWVAKITRKTEKKQVSDETKQETQELNEEWKAEFIERLKKLPDYEWSKVKEAIEKWTIEIKKIPDRNWYAIYESKIWNLVYITRMNWEWYMNIDHYRTVEMLSDMFKAWYIRQWYSNIKLENWLRKLYDKKWKEIPVFSDEYSTTTLNAINLVLDFGDYITEEAERRWIK